MVDVNPRVSVIVPAWNSEHSIGATLRSVLAQTEPSWEAIVVDDGSTDDTAGVAQCLGDDRVRVIRQENLGQGAARNRGLREARGEFIAFLDADDEWMPPFLERTLRFLETHPEAVAVSTAFVVRYADGRERIGPAPLMGTGDVPSQCVVERFFHFWARHDHVRTGTVLLRHATVRSAGPQRADLRVSQDLEYWGYLATFGPWGFMPEPLWVGNSRSAAAGGWLKKYRTRRRLCPTVESWQSRILHRLKPDDVAGFEQVRGRVAAGFAHHMIIGGSPLRALETVRAYGAAMPPGAVTRILRAGARAGWPAWLLVCGALHVREYGKALKMSLPYGRGHALAR